MNKHDKYIATVADILRATEEEDRDDADLPNCDAISCFSCPFQHRTDDDGNCPVTVAEVRDWWWANVMEAKHGK